MSTPENIFPTPEPANDPKTNNVEQEVITNTEESDKVVNTDAPSTGVDDTTEIMTDHENYPDTAGESANATEEEASAGDTATDADVAGGNPVI